MVSRRDALKRIAVGGAAAATAPFWADVLTSAAEQHAAHYHQAARAAAWTPKVLTRVQNEAVIALSEAIIPQTDTAGAAKAGVNQFIDAVLADAPAAERQKFLDGLAWVDARSQRDAGAPFAKATAEQQTALLTTLSAANPSSEDAPGAQFFAAIKSLTITGYYTSEVGMKEEMGDTGQMFFMEYPGCSHPEHKN